MAAAGLPFLCHTGGEMTVPVINRSYQDPRILRRPLELGVKVIRKHFSATGRPERYRIISFEGCFHGRTLAAIAAGTPVAAAITAAAARPARALSVVHSSTPGKATGASSRGSRSP